jgi:ABC-type spermidine/putrescine transport system permease subunit II
MTASRKWLAAASVFDLLLLYLPVAILTVFSFNASRFSAAWQGFTLQWYTALAADESLRSALYNSLTVASVSTVFATGLGLGVALGIHRRARSRGQGLTRLLEGMLLLPLIIPEVMMGVSLVLFFVLIKLPLGLLTIILGHTTFNVPVVVIIILARLRKLDPALEEAAEDLGASSWQAFRRVTLPLLMPAIVAGMLMAFTISLDDFIVTFFTAGPGSTTLPLKVYSMLKSGLSPVINALSAILVIISMGLIGVALFVQRDAVSHQ